MKKLTLSVVCLFAFAQADSLRAECDHPKEWVKHTFTSKKLTPMVVMINGVQVDPSVLATFLVDLPDRSAPTTLDGVRMIVGEIEKDGTQIEEFELTNQMNSTHIQFEK